MLEEDNLGWLLSFRLSLILYHLVVFGKLDLISLNHLCDLRLL